MNLFRLKSILTGSVCAATIASSAYAANFDIPSGELRTALNTYAMQSGIQLVVSGAAIQGVHTRGVKGNLPVEVALARILAGTGLTMRRESSAVAIVPAVAVQSAVDNPVQVAQAFPRPAAAAGIESVIVTSSKIKGDIQTVPIAITALSQEQLTSRQIAGGPDLVKEVPNLTFSKTNFTGYNIQIRGIGTQAISVTTDPAVAVAFNDMPFIRNHFFEQEFYDVSQVEVLRGPQGTLYGRNATAGVVNVISAKPTDQFEAMASADFGNYHNRRFEGMINIPVIDDRVDLRVAGEWTKRDGYSFNQLTNSPIDGRDLWSSRVTLGWKPFQNVQTYLVWEHFQENDDRMRTAKQLCKTDPVPTEVLGVPVDPQTGGWSDAGDYLSQGCRMGSLYAPSAFEVPNGYSLPYYSAFGGVYLPIRDAFNPYASTTQSRNLRVIESSLNPVYKAKNDTLEFNADYTIDPALTLSSQTGFNHDFLWSTEDYNRFNTQPGAFTAHEGPFDSITQPDPSGLGHCSGGDTLNPGGCNSDRSTEGAICTPGIPGCIPDGVFCDPQLGCSDRLVAQDLSEESAWQLSQEFRLSSDFSGPLNFSVGGNFLHYETEENYYVFINTLTMFAAQQGLTNDPNIHTDFNAWVPGISDNHQCLDAYHGGLVYQNSQNPPDSVLGNCSYIDPNPISSLNGQGHNYFLNQNPYVLNSYAGFGEAYYNIANDLKLTAGLRWTSDHKHFLEIPSELVVTGYGYPTRGVLNQQWNQWTGRFATNWSPKLDFTEQTLVYGSFAHGYKAGGANPPGAVLFGAGVANLETSQVQPDHPPAFKPEFIDAYELGTKNTLLDGALTLDGDVFYYNYKDYQISEIVDRSAINLNFNATVKGAELESTWEPAPGLKFNFAGGYEDTKVGNGQSSIDLMDRTAGDPNWFVIKPFVTLASNCIIPSYVVLYQLAGYGANYNVLYADCGQAYVDHVDPATGLPYVANPTTGVDQPAIPAGAYKGFDPATAPNNGEGIAKNLSGNQLPNAPHFTASLSAEYTMPVSQDWAATLHSDFYWQSQSFARIFNDRPYDKIRGYSNVNLALILTSAEGWQVMGYLKNVFNTTAITGDFLNSDDSGLTTNVFLTDPRLFGVRVTKNW
ncbi:MAG TPA: TonB-dependent receptor [Rhizomicrobium sp.]|nr:TonB-dependent receptor [Rhizomicrobium sp.]